MPTIHGVLSINPEIETEQIVSAIRKQVRETLRRRGAVLGLSGGIDSSVCAALCVRALGNENVLCLLLPERDSSSDSTRLGTLIAESLRITYQREEITSIMEGAGCYRRQLEAIRMIFPDATEEWKFKITLPPILDSERLPVSYLDIRLPSGETRKERIPLGAYQQLVAATNFKQRTRKMLEYYHADRMHYAVCGTPNRLEYDQGFFVKNGDGSADFKPIAHLYKSQVYQLAAYLGLPEEIQRQLPTTDTFSFPQTQEEFYFRLPYEQMDLCLYGLNNGQSAEETASHSGLSSSQVERVYNDIRAKRRATRYLHLPPLLVSNVYGIDSHQ